MLALVGMATGTLFLAGCQSRNNEADNPNRVGVAGAGRKVTIGFLVSDKNLAWYSTQIKAAEEKCKELNCEIASYEARDTAAMESALTDLAGRRGTAAIIASSNPAIGNDITRVSETYRIRVVTMDVRLTATGPTAEPKYLDKPFVGPDYRVIGNMIAQTGLDEAKKRGWDMATVGVIGVKLNDGFIGLMRARGSEETFEDAGIPANRMFVGQWPQPASAENAQTTAAAQFARGGGVQRWIGFAYNDTSASAIVRAATARGITSENLIVVGATGFGAAAEFAKGDNGFFASVMVSPKKQATTALEMTYEWAAKGVEPDTLPIFQEPIVITRENYQAVLKEEGLL